MNKVQSFILKDEWYVVNIRDIKTIEKINFWNYFYKIYYLKIKFLIFIFIKNFNNFKLKNNNFLYLTLLI